MVLTPSRFSRGNAYQIFKTVCVDEHCKKTFVDRIFGRNRATYLGVLHHPVLTGQALPYGCYYIHIPFESLHKGFVNMDKVTAKPEDNYKIRNIF